jgi:hypothetical protein
MISAIKLEHEANLSTTLFKSNWARSLLKFSWSTMLVEMELEHN